MDHRDETSHGSGDPPYSDVFVDLLRSILGAMGDVVEATPSPFAPGFHHALINRHFAWLCHAFDHGVNRHLFDGTMRLESLRTEGLRDDQRARLGARSAQLLRERKPLAGPGTDKLVQSGQTRISRLILNEFARATESRNSVAQALAVSIVLPSPLRVAIAYLTDPDIPETRQFAFYTARQFLFETLDCAPENFTSPSSAKVFGPNDIADELSVIYTSIRERRDSKGFDPLSGAASDRTGSLLRHLFAIDGYFSLRFKTRADALAYCRSIEPEKTIAPRKKAPFEFEKVKRLRRLPANGMVVNQLMGTPVPLRGATTLFAGGLQLNSENGLVIAIQGGPGAGKTSLALALSASLAPLNFHTLFVTAEETRLDLQHKIEALRPNELHRISCVRPLKDNLSYINVLDVEEDEPDDTTIMQQVVGVLNEHYEALNENNQLVAPGQFVAPTKSIIVLDGLHDMLAESGDDGDTDDKVALREIIDYCRQQQSLVILTNGIEWADKTHIEYLVDMSLTIEHLDTQAIDAKPRRQVVIGKSRHQLASIGAHGFQIGGDRGFRFSPQANYQLDHMNVLEPELVDTNGAKRLSFQYSYHSPGSRGPIGSPTIGDSSNWFFPRANIFINGRGSGGKAGLALRIAMTPYENAPEGRSPSYSKVLVISFLYGQQYYSNLFDVLRPRIIAEFGTQEPGYFQYPYVMQLYPGSLRPDELFNKIRSAIDAEIIRGEPFTDVIVDGMHNVFLQFPDLEKTMVFWPQLFSLMRQYDVTFISTNTILVVDDPSHPSGMMVVDNGKSEPLRQALVSKTDFHIEVARRAATTEREEDDNYFQVVLRSAVGQRINRKPLLWDRERLIVVSEAQGELPFPELPFPKK